MAKAKDFLCEGTQFSVVTRREERNLERFPLTLAREKWALGNKGGSGSTSLGYSMLEPADSHS